jgi:micrococcal nuclease
MRRVLVILTAAAVVLLSAAGCTAGSTGKPDVLTSVGSTASPAPEPVEDPDQDEATPETPGRVAFVSRVIDGDTIEVRLGGRTVDVRLIGIDTPETVHPTEPVECFGAAASSFTKRQLEGREVRLEFDVERPDRYGRMLAYVWLADQLFNEVLVDRGFAQVSTYPPNVMYVDRFLEAQRHAREDDRGLWGGGCEDEAEESPSGGGSPECDDSYPDVCIAPYPPDLDCADVPYTNFVVRGPDPHGFDGDSDGEGCET